ncbi:hypothetical protein RU93_GL001998 [Enterococcus aquimarinus]|uniref:Uncharacterized protein n=1 Tax=Enterococcus aquimarinus TaxID=328396 RepID=A0A1L8QTF4_9ENTE|nr:hypothetical protein RU93_GL001998 [Enterococcus aquimarinus]
MHHNTHAIFLRFIEKKQLIALYLLFNVILTREKKIIIVKM